MALGLDGLTRFGLENPFKLPRSTKKSESRSFPMLCRIWSKMVTSSVIPSIDNRIITIEAERPLRGVEVCCCIQYKVNSLTLNRIIQSVDCAICGLTTPAPSPTALDRSDRIHSLTF